jgi:hypothetical protein
MSFTVSMALSFPDLFRVNKYAISKNGWQQADLTVAGGEGIVGGS